MSDEFPTLLVAGLTGALVGFVTAWLVAPRRAPKLKPLVRRNHLGQRTVEDIVARLELEQAGRGPGKSERWSRITRQVAAFDQEQAVAPGGPRRPALPSYDPGLWNPASLSQLSFGLS